MSERAKASEPRERSGASGAPARERGGGRAGAQPPALIRIELPAHLSTLARVRGEIQLGITGPVTQRAILDALERAYPALEGTIRYHGTAKRRPLVRFFACEEDLSNAAPDAPLPDAVADGREPFLIIGAIAGG